MSSGEPGGGSPVGAGAGWKLSRDGSGVLGCGSRERFGPGGSRGKRVPVCRAAGALWGSWRRAEIEPGWFRWRWAAGLGRDSGRAETGRESSGEPGSGSPVGAGKIR